MLLCVRVPVRVCQSLFFLVSLMLKQPQQPAFIKLFQAGLLWVSVCLARVADCFLLAMALGFTGTMVGALFLCVSTPDYRLRMKSLRIFLKC